VQPEHGAGEEDCYNSRPEAKRTTANDGKKPSRSMDVEGGENKRGREGKYGVAESKRCNTQFKKITKRNSITSL
jgi:hypothetical protein